MFFGAPWWEYALVLLGITTFVVGFVWFVVLGYGL